MTIEKILTQLNRIPKDASYEVIDNFIDLTIDHFEGFEEFEDSVDDKTVYEVLEWLEKNAAYIEDNCYCYYHFGDIVVELGYTS